MDTSVPAVLDRRTLMKGAAAVGVATAATVGLADRASASTVTLDPASGQGAANKAALQAAINATPAGEVLALPDGTFEIDVSSGGLTIPASITIAGSGATTLDVLPKTAGTMNSLFTVPSSVAKGNFRFENLRIEGPTSTTSGGSAIEWVRLGGIGSITCFLVSVTGQFQYAVRRSGVGLVELIACQMNAKGSVVQVTDNGSGAGPSRCVVVGCQLTGDGAVMGNYGIDIQPHIALQCAATRFERFHVLAIIVQSGASTPVPTWSVTDCQVIDAGLAQTGANSHATFTRVVQTVSASMPQRESTLRGSATFLDCDLRGGWSFTSVATSSNTQRFISCWFEPKGAFIVVGGTNSAKVVFDDCTWKLVGSGRAAYVTNTFTGTLRFRRSLIADCGTTSNNIALYGGTTVFTGTTIDSPKTNGGISTTSGATISPAPTLTNSGTCPTAPTH